MRCDECGSRDPSIHLHVCCTIQGDGLTSLHDSRLLCEECALCCLSERKCNAVAMRAATSIVAHRKCNAVTDTIVEEA